MLLKSCICYAPRLCFSRAMPRATLCHTPFLRDEVKKLEDHIFLLASRNQALQSRFSDLEARMNALEEFRTQADGKIASLEQFRSKMLPPSSLARHRYEDKILRAKKYSILQV